MIHVTNAVPTATITVKRNRVKTYGNAVYLQPDSSFEIELFNPRQTRVLAAIVIDGKNISSSGIVLRPGERVYLERWIDEARKFKFSTYNVENSQEAKSAIQNNGNIEVFFYEETPKYLITTSSSNFFYNGSGNSGLSGTCTYITNPTYTTYTSLYDGTLNSTNSVRSKSSKSIETGITEKGDNSSQDFDTTTGDFNNYTVAYVSLKLLPISSKPVEYAKIRAYCTNCGTRVRAESWNFCPSCGSKRD